MASTDFNLGGGSAPDGLDRRGDMRRPLRTACKLTVGAHALVGRTIDIGTHGMSIAVDRNLPIRTDCRLAFTMPLNGHSHALDLHARVVHGVLCASQGFKIGFELLETSGHDDQLIEQYLAR